MRYAPSPFTSIAVLVLAGSAGCAHPQSAPASTGTLSPEVPATFDQARQQCDGGDQQACVVLAGFYWRGVGVARDPARARSLIEAACGAGNTLGCELRDRFASPAEPTAAPPPAAPPSGPASSGVDATGILEQRCGERDFNACAGLGTLYLRGVGVPADAVKAKHYLQQACDGGNANGCEQLRSANASPRP